MLREAKKLLAEIARRFLNKEGKTDKGLPVRDNEARKDFYKNIIKELNFSGGIIVSRAGLGLINQNGRYVSGDEAAESLNDFVSGIRVKGLHSRKASPFAKVRVHKRAYIILLKTIIFVVNQG